jgi:hypothetical protein
MENIEDILARYKRIREQNMPKPVVINRALEFRLKTNKPELVKKTKYVVDEGVKLKIEYSLDKESADFRKTLEASKISITKKQKIKVEHVPVEDPVRFADIVKWVCGKTGFTKMELFSARRNAELCTARHLVWQIAHKLTSLSYPQMGKLSGHKDHTTVLHAIRKTPPNLHEYIDQFMADLNKQRELEEA